jgi:hypothetical protein
MLPVQPAVDRSTLQTPEKSSERFTITVVQVLMSTPEGFKSRCRIESVACCDELAREGIHRILVNDEV